MAVKFIKGVREFHLEQLLYVIIAHGLILL